MRLGDQLVTVELDLLGHELLERDVVGELRGAAERGDRVHHAEHRGDRGLVAHGPRGVGQGVAVEEGRDGARQRNERHEDGEHPQHDLGGIGDREDPHDPDGGGDHHGEGEHLHEDGTVGGVRVLRQDVRARGVVMGDHNHRAVARRGERPLGLVVRDDVLGQAARPDLRICDAPRPLEHEQRRAGDHEDGADDTQGAPDAHEHRRHEQHGAQDGAHELGRRGRRELLYLGLEAMAGEDARELVGGCALLLAARWGYTDVLKQVVQIFLGIGHRGSASFVLLCGPFAQAMGPYVVESIP